MDMMEENQIKEEPVDTLQLECTEEPGPFMQTGDGESDERNMDENVSCLSVWPRMISPTPTSSTFAKTPTSVPNEMPGNVVIKLEPVDDYNDSQNLPPAKFDIAGLQATAVMNENGEYHSIGVSYDDNGLLQIQTIGRSPSKVKQESPNIHVSVQESIFILL
jgi:hypothetical protein